MKDLSIKIKKEIGQEIYDFICSNEIENIPNLKKSQAYIVLDKVRNHKTLSRIAKEKGMHNETISQKYRKGIKCIKEYFMYKDVINVLDKPITQLPLSRRVINGLQRFGLKTGKEIFLLSDHQLMEIRDFGKICLKEINSFKQKFSAREDNGILLFIVGKTFSPEDAEKIINMIKARTKPKPDLATQVQ